MAAIWENGPSLKDKPQYTIIMCLACETNLNPEALSAFGDRFLDILNAGATVMLMSVGYRTRLFEAMADGAWLTSEELARRASLQERYVREWCGAMVAGKVIETQPDGRLFRLPPEHAALLTDAEGGENLGHLTQYVSMIGFIEDRLVQCFREGGGVPYSAYPRFHEIMAIDSKQTIVDPLFEHILPLDSSLTDRLEAGIDVLDVGCGRGKALLRMAARFPRSRFTGLDLSEEAIEHARREAEALGLKNVRFEARDLTDFHQTAPSERFDLITAFDAIHDQARPDQVLSGIHRALRPDGLFLMQDIAASSNIADNRDHPLGPLLYGISCAHCMTVSLAQGGLGLGAMWGEQLTRDYLATAGFDSVEKRTLEHDFQNYYYLVRGRKAA